MHRTGWDDFPKFHVPSQLSEGKPITAPIESLARCPTEKRYLTCLLALLMPDQGIDENFETALECWNFYAHRPTPTALPSSGLNPVKVKFTGYSPRPGLVLAE
jgi:hypothetical protein